MEKLIKLFPFMPAPKDGGKLALAIVFYVIAPFVASTILGFLLGITIILAPLAFIVGLAAFAYTVAGIVFAVLSFNGQDLNTLFEKKTEE